MLPDEVTRFHYGKIYIQSLHIFYNEYIIFAKRNKIIQFYWRGNMKQKIMDVLQRFSKAMFIPVLILPIAGILIAVGNLFTNAKLLEVLPFMNNPITTGFGTLLSGSLVAILNNLGLIFCVGLAVGLANKKKSEAGFTALLAFLVFINAMNKFMDITGVLYSGESLRGTGQALVLCFPNIWGLSFCIYCINSSNHLISSCFNLCMAICTSRDI